MGLGHLYIGVSLFLVFIMLDAIIYAFGASIDSLNENIIEEKVKNGNKRAKLLTKIIDGRNPFDKTVNLMGIVSNVVAGSYILASISGNISRTTGIHNNWISVGIAVGMIFILLSLGVLIPQRIGRRFPERTALRYVYIVNGLILILTPFAFLASTFSNLVLRIFGIKPDKNQDNVTEEEIITMVNEGQEQGVLEANEAEMITNIFELGDKHAGDVMIHRSNISAVEAEITLEEFIQKHLEGRYSRFPVYEGAIDNIVATIHIRDALILHRQHSNRKKKIKDIEGLLREPFLVPESRDIDEILKDMQEMKVHMGVVVDEYGQTVGLITMEDIIEEIVGNILDEYDEEKEFATQNGEDDYVVDGLTEIEDINELLGIKIESEDFETLNGFLMSKLGRVAKENETELVEEQGYIFDILEVNNNVIRKVEIKKK